MQKYEISGYDLAHEEMIVNKPLSMIATKTNRLLGYFGYCITEPVDNIAINPDSFFTHKDWIEPRPNWRQFTGRVIDSYGDEVNVRPTFETRPRVEDNQDTAGQLEPAGDRFGLGHPTDVDPLAQATDMVYDLADRQLSEYVRRNPDVSSTQDQTAPGHVQLPPVSNGKGGFTRLSRYQSDYGNDQIVVEAVRRSGIPIADRGFHIVRFEPGEALLQVTGDAPGAELDYEQACQDTLTAAQKVADYFAALPNAQPDTGPQSHNIVGAIKAALARKHHG